MNSITLFCALLPPSDVHNLKKTQHPFSLVLAIWSRAIVGDTPAASSKVKWMSGTSAFLRRTYGEKSESKRSVSTPWNIKVYEDESLIRQQYKILSTSESALAINFLFNSFFSEWIWHVGFCKAWYYEIFWVVVDWVFELLLYTEAVTRTNCSMSRHKVIEGRSNTFFEL